MRWLSAKFLFVCFLVAVLSGCGKNSAPVISMPTAAQVAEFTGKAGISLLASAKVLGWMENRGMDDALWLKVGISVQDLGAFVNSSPFKDGGLETNQQYHAYNFKDFLPAPPTKFRSGQKGLPNAKTLNMLIDESNPTNAVVYMMWFEM